MGARLDDLAAIEHAVWQELQRAAGTRGHAWRVAVLATADGDGVDARNVVLREVDPAARQLRIYTDARSAKLAQLSVQPQAMLVLWSDALGWQLRAKVLLQAETAGLAVSSRWAKIKLTPAAHDYLSPLPPGSPLAQPMPERGSREHFAVLTATVQSLDWLELHADGHRRARFDAGGRRWLAP